MYSLLVADDHPLFRDALHAVISSGFTDAQLLETDSLAGAMAHIEALEGLDLLLLDLSLPDADGLEGLKTTGDLPRAARCHRVSPSRAPAGAGCDYSGGRGYIPKSTPREQLLSALQQILQGQLYLPADIMRRPPPRAIPAAAGEDSEDKPSRLPRLTDKQLDVLGCMSQGMSNKQIARELDIAETTVKTHVSAILRKLGATSRVHAIVMAGEEDLNGYIAKRMAR